MDAIIGLLSGLPQVLICYRYRQDEAQRQGWRCRQGSLEGCRRMLTRSPLKCMNNSNRNPHLGTQVSQGPHLDHLPPPQDPSALSVAQVPAYLHPPRYSSRLQQGHPVPSQHRECHEEDRGEQHPGLHRGRQVEQAPDQAGPQEAVRCRDRQGQHPRQV